MFLQVVTKPKQKYNYHFVKRNLLVQSILYIITFGLYGVVWAQELDDAFSHSMSLVVYVWLFTMGFSGLVWCPLLGSSINESRAMRGVNDKYPFWIPFLMFLLYLPTLGLGPLLIAQYFANEACNIEERKKKEEEQKWKDLYEKFVKELEEERKAQARAQQKAEQEAQQKAQQKAPQQKTQKTQPKTKHKTPQKAEKKTQQEAQKTNT